MSVNGRVSSRWLNAAQLAWAHAISDPWRSALLIVAVAAAGLVPLTVQTLLRSVERTLVDRALATPLVIGSPGSRFDLVLSALHFRGRVPRAIPMREVERVRATGLADALPLHVRHTAQRRYPVVGTTLEYFAFRELQPAEGSLPVLLGDCVLGATLASEIGAQVGDKLASDPENLHDVGGAHPLRMHVAGILAPTRTPDDRAVFVDLHTAWILDGLGHGHVEAESDGESFDESLFHIEEITPENIASFHIHAERSTLPVTSVIVVPRGEDPNRNRAKLRARYRNHDRVQMLYPSGVIDELLAAVLRTKRILDANTLLVAAASAGFLVIIAILGVRTRRAEFATLARLGATPSLWLQLVAIEFVTLIGCGLALGAGFAVVAAAWFPLDILLPTGS